MEINANWGYRVKSNVQPGKGKTTRRDYSSEELAALLDAAERLNISSEELKTVLGEKTLTFI